MSKLNIKERIAKNKGKLIMILCTILLSVIVFTIYRILLNFYYFEIILGIYMGITTALLLAYLIYNRGFSRKDVTIEMLPLDWSEDRKRNFIDNAEKRVQKSRWLFVILLSFILTFVFDAIDLFVRPLLAIPLLTLAMG